MRNSNQRYSRERFESGFSLIEALVTIALLAVLAAIVVSSYTNASTQSHEVIARQQAAAVKSALDSYITAQLSTTSGGGGVGRANSLKSIYTVREDYNGLDTLGRWSEIETYLDVDSLARRRSGGFEVNGDIITSRSLEKSGDALELPDWGDGSNDYPLVDLVDAAAE